MPPAARLRRGLTGSQRREFPSVRTIGASSRRASGPRARRRRDDSGQLMMLAGIVLTISFILTSLTLTQVATLEREAAGETPAPIVGEWRFLHDRLGSNLDTAVGPETEVLPFLQTILPTVQATFRSVQAEKGYDLVIRAAGDETDYDATGSEVDLVSGANYDEWTWNGGVHFTHPVPADAPYSDRHDGVVWSETCPEPGAPAAGCIVGVYLYVRLTDGQVTIEESMLFATNQG